MPIFLSLVIKDGCKSKPSRREMAAFWDIVRYHSTGERGGTSMAVPHSDVILHIYQPKYWLIMLDLEFAIIITIAIMLSIPVTFFPLPQAQGAPAHSFTIHPITPDTYIATNFKPVGVNMTGSNMTGAAGNTSAHG